MEFKQNLEFSLKTKWALYCINKKRNTCYNILKVKQIQCVRKALYGDLLVILPTGYGKSLIYELIQNLSRSKIFIVSPINAIINEQLEKFGDAALRIDSSTKTEIEKHGARSIPSMGENVDYIIGRPEDLTSKTFCDILPELNWNVSHVFVDEAHCVVSWGVSGFRPTFMEISKLRSIFQNVTMVGMTATASIDMQNGIKTALSMNDPYVVANSPDRDNIKITIKKRPATGGTKRRAEDVFKDFLKPYVQDILSLGQEFPKTIIYTTLQMCGLGYETVWVEACKSGRTDMMQYVSQYHAPSTEEKKKTLSANLRSSDCNVRLLFATEALGMGTDAPDIRQVIHIGPPNTVETYVQEMGRAGRDGKQSYALLFYNASDIAANRKHLASTMKDFCTVSTDQCRREYICRHFGFQDYARHILKHNCCDVCEKNCECDMCFGQLIGSMAVENKDDTCINNEKENQPTPLATKCTETLNQALCCYVDAVNSKSVAVYTGLTYQLVDKICTYPFNCSDQSELQQYYPHIDEEHIASMCHIIRTVLDH